MQMTRRSMPAESERSVCRWVVTTPFFLVVCDPRIRVAVSRAEFNPFANYYGGNPKG